MITYTLDPITGILSPVLYLASSHADERPPDAEIDMVVIHGISLPPGEFGGSAVSQFFTGQLAIAQHPYYASISHLRVSAHLFIRRCGEVIQFVPFTKRAWHAGESCFQGKTRCNDFSIGIELEGTDEVPYEAIQYQQLEKIIHLLMRHYPAITRDRIVGHEHIAPGRKTDPGPFFNWELLKGKLA